MRKHHIALAIAAALAGVAHADSGNVTIKGDLRVGVQFSNDQASFYEKKNSSAATAARQTAVDGRGNIYFGGAEDLGNGNSAIFQIGSRFSTDGSGVDEFGTSRDGTFGNRNTWVGLKGGWGTLRLGKGEDNYGDGKYDKLTVWGDTPLIGSHAKRHSDSNMVRYDLPALGQFSGSLQYKAGEDKTTTTKANDAYLFRGDYNADNWDVGFGYEGGRKGGDKLANYILAADLKFDAFQAGVEYSSNKDKTTDGVGKTTGLYLNYTMDKWNFAAQYYKQKVTAGSSASIKFDLLGTSNGLTVPAGTSVKAKTFALGAGYALSKRTKVFGEYWQGKLENTKKARVFEIGVKHSF